MTRVTFSSVTVSWKAVLSERSVAELKGIGVDHRIPTMSEEFPAELGSLELYDLSRGPTV